MRRQIELNALAENVVAKVTLRVRFIDGLIHHADQIPKFAADVDVTLLCTNCQAGNQHAFNQLVGIEFHQQTVLAGTRLRFVSIHYDVLGFGRGAGHKAPLHSGREACAAATTENRSLHLADDLVLRHTSGFFKALVAVSGEVRINRLRIREPKPARQYRSFQRTGWVVTHQQLTF